MTENAPPFAVRRVWKRAIRDTMEYRGLEGGSSPVPFLRSDGLGWDEKAVRGGVARGRYFVREMVGVIQLKKYRAMKQKYGDEGKNFDDIARGVEREWAKVRAGGPNG